jgi:hypothetical protein
MAVELANRFFDVPCGGHFASGVPGAQQTEQLLLADVVEALLGSGQQSPTPIERIGLATSVPQGLVLDTPPTLIQLGVGLLHDVKRIGHLGGVRDDGVEHGAIGAREIERRETDLRQLLLTAGLEPGCWLLSILRAPVTRSRDPGR